MPDWSDLDPNEWGLCGDGTRWRYETYAIYLVLPEGEILPVPNEIALPHSPEAPVTAGVPQPDGPERQFRIAIDPERSSDEYQVYTMTEVT